MKSQNFGHNALFTCLWKLYVSYTLRHNGDLPLFVLTKQMYRGHHQIRPRSQLHPPTTSATPNPFLSWTRWTNKSTKKRWGFNYSKWNQTSGPGVRLDLLHFLNNEQEDIPSGAVGKTIGLGSYSISGGNRTASSWRGDVISKCDSSQAVTKQARISGFLQAKSDWTFS